MTPDAVARSARFIVGHLVGAPADQRNALLTHGLAVVKAHAVARGLSPETCDENNAVVAAVVLAQLEALDLAGAWQVGRA